MATRSTVDFKIGNRRVARIYRHYDGYPEWALIAIKAGIELALAAYNKEGGFGYRLNNLGSSMDDVAAFYVLANKKGAGNIYIDSGPLHCDLEYFYEVSAKGSVVFVKIYEPKSGWEGSSKKGMKLLDNAPLDFLMAKWCEAEMVEFYKARNWDVTPIEDQAGA